MIVLTADSVGKGLLNVKYNGNEGRMAHFQVTKSVQ